ncbi:MAG: HAD family phosphatase [Lachnospiraceae bacterium]|nr:HAD family phosphatase [Lachnospiraceae bacterium]
MEIWMNDQLNEEALWNELQDKKGIIFDMDGTLLDSMTMWHVLDIQYLNRFGIVPESDFQQTVATMTLSVAAEYMCEHFDLPRSPKQIEDDFCQMVREQYKNILQLKPGALSLIQKLHAKGFLMMVATANEYEIVHPALLRTGVWEYIYGLVTCTMAGENKESPAVYQLACDEMGLGRSECVVFEDSLFAIKTAKNAGFSVVAVYDDASKDCWNEIKKITNCQVVF